MPATAARSSASPPAPPSGPSASWRSSTSPPSTRWVYETAATDSFVSIEKAERILGYRPKYSNQQALVRNYDWYIENLAHFENASGVTHRVPWKQGILKLAKVFF